MTVVYPDMAEQLSNPRYLNLLMAHLDCCKDVCDSFGISTALVPYRDPKRPSKIVGFTLKSFRNPDKKDNYEEFDYDPFWDDGTDFDALYKGIDDEYITKEQSQPKYPEIVNKVPDDDDEIIDITKKWVNKLMSDMGICPFTQGPDRAGLPMGDVFYCVDRSSTMEDMYARYWKEVVRVEQHNEKDLSTTLLIAPEFCLDNVEMFESFSTTLTQPLTALGVEGLLQLVFFHPQWSFRDGDARSGEGEAANYARRSPWPMINILRTSQVRAAQKGIPTGLVYKQNEKTLASVGVDKLETMLRLRDWSDIADVTVNRKEYDALKIAQEYQQTGVVKQQDMSLDHDATPAANKVERSQVEQGNLVNVLCQALEKRLGKTDENSIQPLTGPETSAAAMATGFLIQQLEDVGAGGGAAAAETVTPASSTSSSESSRPQQEQLDVNSRKARLRAARQAMLDDMAAESSDGMVSSDDRGFGDPAASVLFGGAGIPDTAEDTSISEDFDPTDI